MFLYDALDSAFLIFKLPVNMGSRQIPDYKLFPMLSSVMINILKKKDFIAPKYLETIYMAIYILTNNAKRNLYNLLGDSFLSMIIKNNKMELLTLISSKKFICYVLCFVLSMFSFFILFFMQLCFNKIELNLLTTLSGVSILCFGLIIYLNSIKIKHLRCLKTHIQIITLFGIFVQLVIFNLTHILINSFALPNYIPIIIFIIFLCSLHIPIVYFKQHFTVITSLSIELSVFLFFHVFFPEHLKLVIIIFTLVFVSTILLFNRLHKLNIKFIKTYFTLLLGIHVSCNTSVKCLIIITVTFWNLFFGLKTVKILYHLIKEDEHVIGCELKELFEMLEIKFFDARFIHSGSKFNSNCKTCTSLVFKTNEKMEFKNIDFSNGEFSLELDKINETIVFDFNIQSNISYAKQINDEVLPEAIKIKLLKYELNQKLMEYYGKMDTFTEGSAAVSNLEDFESPVKQKEEIKPEIQKMIVNFSNLENINVSNPFQVKESIDSDDEPLKIFPDQNEGVKTPEPSFQELIDASYQKIDTKKNFTEESKIFNDSFSGEYVIEEEEEFDESNKKDIPSAKRGKVGNEDVNKRKVKYEWCDSLSKFQVIFLSSESETFTGKSIEIGEVKSLSDNYLNSIIIETVKNDSINQSVEIFSRCGQMDELHDSIDEKENQKNRKRSQKGEKGNKKQKSFQL